jgi:hypothetical protein
MAHVLIRVSPKGEVAIKAEGWQGPTCTMLTQPFRDALGKEVAQLPTSDFYAESTRQVEVQQNT